MKTKWVFAGRFQVPWRHNGEEYYLWIRKQVPPVTLKNLFITRTVKEFWGE